VQAVKTLLGLEANLDHFNSSAEVAFNHAANDDHTEVTQTDTYLFNQGLE